MIISPAKLDDIPQLVGLLALLFEQEEEMRPDAERQGQGLRMILEHPATGTVLVLRDQQRVAGMASLLYSVSTALGARAAWLEDVIVHPDDRGQGHGTRLLQAALAHARQAGCARVSLLTDAANQRAQSLYQRLGFVPSSMRVFRREAGSGRER